MANSTAITFSQSLAIDNSGTGAGTQWLSVLHDLFRAFFADADDVDSGRWRLVDSSPVVGDWSSIANVVDNSWFVVEALKGRQQWQCKFQATNVAALDEAPAGTYRVAARFSPGGGWTAKGAANGGFAAAPTVASANLLLGGGDYTAAANGVVHVHSDRDTVLIAIAHTGTAAYDGGCYVGRIDPDTDRIPYPSCLLTAGAVLAGFDRAGAFATTPTESFALSSALVPVADVCEVHTSGWMDTAHQPSFFSGEYTYRPLEIAGSDSPLGYLRLIWSCANLAALSRMDNRQKLVLHNGGLSNGVAVVHNGLILP
jgi:hypothetical protein